MTPSELRKAIRDAEEEHIAYGLAVEMAADALTLALGRQSASRNRLAALRQKQLELYKAEEKEVAQ